MKLSQTTVLYHYITLLSATIYAFNPTSLLSKSTVEPAPPPSKIDKPQWLADTLKYPGEPKSDVLRKTIEWANLKKYEERALYFDKDYVFRGSIIGPITYDDVVRTPKGFQI
jgi:hypothetical protein